MKQAAEAAAPELAAAIAADPFHIITGAGSTWPQAFYYGMCILEEMQWIRTRPVHAADFFHGTLELVEQGVSVLLLKGEDAARPLAERVESFVGPVFQQAHGARRGQLPAAGDLPPGARADLAGRAGHRAGTGQCPPGGAHRASAHHPPVLPPCSTTDPAAGLAVATVGDNTIDEYTGQQAGSYVGGNALNVAVNCVRLGLAAEYFGAVGPDPRGQRVRDTLRRQGVGTEGLAVLDGVTSVSIIRVDESGDRHFEHEDFGVCARYVPGEEDLRRLAGFSAVHLGLLPQPRRCANGSTPAACWSARIAR